MKKILQITALLAAILALPLAAFADVGSVDLGITNQLVAGAATTINPSTNAVVIDKMDRCAIQFSFQGTNSNAQVIQAYFLRSGDGVTYETTPFCGASFTANGTTAVSGITNLDNTVIGAIYSFKLSYLTNAGGADVTNCSLKVIKKTIKPSP